MKRLIKWATANPILTVSATLVPVCISVIVYVAMSGAALRTDIKAKMDKRLHSIRSLMNYNVDVPSNDPDGKTKSISFCVTEDAIGQYNKMRNQMDQSYREIFKNVRKRNQQGRNFPHEPMAPGLFPGHQIDPGLPFRAKKQYKKALVQFTMPPEPGAMTPRLNGGRPLNDEQIQDALAQVENEYSRRAHGGGHGAGAIDDDEQEELFEEQRQRLWRLFHDHAKAIQMYVHAPQEDDDGSGEAILETPFYLGPWVLSGDKPSLLQLWEGQLDLWIQQDIVEAIARTNEGSINVLDAPIKRLVRMFVEPGYVGINTEGVVRGFDPNRFRSAGGTGSSGMVPTTDAGVYPTRSGGRNPQAGAMPHAGIVTGGASTPYGDELDDDGQDEQLTAPDGTIKDDYELSPTGRQSNSLYDVRHAVVTVIIDSKRIEAFLDNVSKVNFMTVLLMSLHDVNEFEHLRGTTGGHSYFYGPHDAMELTIVIETLWLRNWTSGHWDMDEAKRLGETYEAGLMPDDVRELLNLKRREANHPKQAVSSNL